MLNAVGEARRVLVLEGINYPVSEPWQRMLHDAAEWVAASPDRSGRFCHIRTLQLRDFAWS
jgi:hypothetical protein